MAQEGQNISCVELEDKALRLAGYRGRASEAEMRRVIGVGGMAEAASLPCSS